MANQKSSKNTPQKGNTPPAVKKAAKKAVKKGMRAATRSEPERTATKPSRVRRGLGCKILPYFFILTDFILLILRNSALTFLSVSL